MIIKNTTKLGPLLMEYPQLRMSIAAVLPDFGSLEQPHLREKVLSFTTLEHLAKKTGQEVSILIKDLNQLIGVPTHEEYEDRTIEFIPEDPDWIQSQPQHIVDGGELLTQGQQPLGVIHAKLEEMSSSEMILLKTNFPPDPMIEAMNSAGADIYSRNDVNDSNLYLTFIKKQSSTV